TVTGAFSGDNANADAELDTLRRGLDDAFVNADGGGGKIFEIEIGILAACRESFVEVKLKVVLREAEFLGEKGLGEAHDLSVTLWPQNPIWPRMNANLHR